MSDSSTIPWPAPTDPRLYVYDRESPIDAVAIPTMVSFSSLTTTDLDTSTTTTIGLLSRDPIGYFDGDNNLYGFLRNSPIRDTDASGFCPKCCQFEQWIIWTRNNTWVDIGRGWQQISQYEWNSDDGYQDRYGDPNSQGSGDSYGKDGCSYSMSDAPGLDLLPNLQNQPRGALTGLVAVKMEVLRTFVARIVDTSNDGRSVWGPVQFHKHCVGEYTLGPGGTFVPKK